MKTFGEKIREARYTAGMTQLQLSEAVGVSTRSIKGYEDNTKHPRVGTIYLLAKALGISVKYLTDDNCQNPLEDIAKDEYVIETQKQYGTKSANELRAMMDECAALFAGGELPEEEMDAYFQAMAEAYGYCKAKAKEKYGRKKKS